MSAPWPLPAGGLDAPLAALAAGAAFEEVLEQLLRSAPLEVARLLMLLHREGRAAWVPLLSAAGGRALFVGNAFSGAPVALARAGFAVTVADRSPERVRFALERLRRAAPRPARGLVAGGARLPFADRAFALAVLEAAPEGAPDGPQCAPRELVRVSAGEALLVADNRFGYKRSAGHRGAFRLAGPRELLRRALRPRPEERTLGAHRRALGAPRTRALALYPHSQDWTHAVALDGGPPLLRVGPKERQNRLKTLAVAAGLFPWLAPSFALFGARQAGRPRLERALDALAERLDAPPMEVEELVATRGNNALVLTRRRGDPTPGGPGRLVLHVPLAAHQRRLVERHARALAALPGRLPGLPVPELVFEGQLEGLWLVAERRVEGLGGPQLSGDAPRVARTLADLARGLASAGRGAPRTPSAEELAAWLSQEFDQVLAKAPGAGTRAALARMRDRARERLSGRPLPLVTCHGDLRAKHVQVDPEGALLAVLDWGTVAERPAPGFDLTHFLLHEWKQAGGGTPGAAWRRLLARRDADAGAHALLAAHAAALGVEPDVQRALEELHPVLVASVAERTWDYSRPRWLERAYEL